MKWFLTMVFQVLNTIPALAFNAAAESPLFPHYRSSTCFVLMVKNLDFSPVEAVFISVRHLGFMILAVHCHIKKHPSISQFHFPAYRSYFVPLCGKKGLCCLSLLAFK